MRSFNYISLLKAFVASGSAFILLGFLWMVHEPLARPIFIDELVYCGQYLYEILLTNCGFLSGNWFWSVDSKQPLLFWVYELAYEIFPESVSDGPLFLIVVPRILSACFIFLSPLVCYFVIVNGKNNRATHLLSTYLVFLSSPFLLIHAQLAIVEPLLVFSFMLTILSLYLYVTKDSLTNFVFLCFSNFLLVMTKTSGLIAICGMAIMSTLFSFFCNRERHNYRKAANIMIMFLTAGYLFATLNPSLHEEASRVFSVSGLDWGRFLFQLNLQFNLTTYYLSYLCIFILLFGAGTVLLNGQGCAVRIKLPALMNMTSVFMICVLLGISLISVIFCSVGLKGDIPRYYIFSFLPLIVASSLLLSYLIKSFNSLLKSNWIRLLFLTCFVCLILFDSFSLLPLFYDHKGNSGRIALADKRQYFDFYSIETLRGIDDYIIGNNAEVYAAIPPYMEVANIRVMIGIKEGQKRIKSLPVSLGEVNKVGCDKRFDATLILVTSALFPKDIQSKFTGLTRIRDYHAGAAHGDVVSLYKKECH